MQRIVCALVVLAGLFFQGQLSADPLLLAANDFESAFGDEQFVSIATGQPQPVRRAPAVTSVITAEDILHMGATTLEEALESVPGLHVSVSAAFYQPKYQIRGISSTYNPHVLVLINGIPQTSVYLGGRGFGWAAMPTTNIARIEIIRGPGSAIYGADAFAGIINIITKIAEDIQEGSAGVRIGSFSSMDVWLLRAGQWGGWQAAMALQLQTTAGFTAAVENDAQTYWDGVFGSNASLAPGNVSSGGDRLDLSLDFSRQAWRVRAGFQGRYHGGTGVGAALALDPVGMIRDRRFNIDVQYHEPQLSPVWDVTYAASLLDIRSSVELVLFPPGAFGGAYPDGMIGRPSLYQRQLRLGASAFYSGIDRHTLRVGAGINQSALYRVTESKNFNPDGSPMGSVVEVSGADLFINRQHRLNPYAFVQDEWLLSPDWVLTAGLRYDRYSDFGATLNPRLVLLWEASHDITTKFLYGRAFRPPSFAELFARNNPVLLGNPDLRPEVIDTWEWALDYIASERLLMHFNLYYMELDGLISFVADPLLATTKTAQNAGRRTGYGLEAELKWRPNNGLDMTINYSRQISQDEVSMADVGFSPGQQLYFRTTWQMAPQWQGTLQMNWVAARARAPGDPRVAVADYQLTDVIVRREMTDQWLLSMVVKNVFDVDVLEPSRDPLALPADLPLAGRSVFIEVQYSL